MSFLEKYIRIRAFNNANKEFIVPYEADKRILEIVNQHYQDPKREGIPYICRKGVCRSCTIEVLENPDLITDPIPNEQRALAVGRTAMKNGFRLACMCGFKPIESDKE